MIFVLNCKSLWSIRWSWCFKPRDEMGKDLAMCLEQFWWPVWTSKLQAFFFIWVIYKLSMSDVSNVVGMTVCQIWNWAGRLWSKDCPASVLYSVSSWSWWSLSSTREWFWIWGGYNMVEFPHQLLQKEHQLETWVMGIESLQSLNLNHLLMRGLEQGKNLKPVRTGRSQNQKLCFKWTESHLSDVNTSKLQSLCPIRCHDWKFYRRRCGWELWQ